MKVTIQYFDGCPHWQLADERVRNVIEGMSNDEVSLEYQLIDSPETADRVGFLGSPTILVDGRIPLPPAQNRSVRHVVSSAPSTEWKGHRLSLSFVGSSLR